MDNAITSDSPASCAAPRQKHGVTTLEWLKSHTIPLFTADHNAIVEWAKTIPWEHVAEYAHMLKPPKDRHEISWLTAEKIIE